jgi:flagellar hook protein FlgE
MYTSIGGLKSHQTMLDTVANNIANVNTFGFKGSRVAFSDMLSQTISGSSAPGGDLGGTNSKQVGLGANIGATQQLMTQGNIQTTGVLTDLAISGDGFFRVTNDGGLIGAAAAPFPEMSYTRAGNFQFDAAGDLVTTDGYYVVGYAEDALVPDTPDLTTETRINIPPGNSTAVSIGQDGRVSYMDTAANIRVDAGWISIAKFANPAGLEPAGGNKWRDSSDGNSGAEVTNIPTAGGNGVIVAGGLEMSNVDLATEFTEMIRAQRGFQANSRTITTSDEILQELVNLKR